jgi:hypothetical protein
MPKKKGFVVTDDFLRDGSCGNAGWTAEQLALLGLHAPLGKGWKDKVIGKVISEEARARFLAIRVEVEERKRLASLRREAPKPAKDAPGQLVMWEI